MSESLKRAASLAIAAAALAAAMLLCLFANAEPAHAAWPTNLPAQSATGKKSTDASGLADTAFDEFRLSLSSYGYRDGAKYWSAQDFHRDSSLKGTREEWCADFVTYCASLAGYVQSGSYPADRLAQCNVGALKEWYAKRPSKGTVFANDGTYIPRKGDIAIRGGDHTGVVYGVSVERNGTIRAIVIEGNAGNKVQKRTYLYSNRDKSAGWTHYISLKPHGKRQVAISLMRALTGIPAIAAYTGGPVKPAPSVKCGGVSIPCNATYLNNVSVGTAKATLKAKANAPGVKSYYDSKIKVDRTVSFSIRAPKLYVYRERKALAEAYSPQYFSTSANDPAYPRTKYQRTDFCLVSQSPTAQVYCSKSARNGSVYYTMDKAAADRMSKKAAWGAAKVAFPYDPKGSKTFYRLYNAKNDAYYYTSSKSQVNFMSKHGWSNQGVAFYGR